MERLTRDRSLTPRVLGDVIVSVSAESRVDTNPVLPTDEGLEEKLSQSLRAFLPSGTDTTRWSYPAGLVDSSRASRLTLGP